MVLPSCPETFGGWNVNRIIYLLSMTGGKIKCSTTILTIRTQPIYCPLPECWISICSFDVTYTHIHIHKHTHTYTKGLNMRHTTQILLQWKQGRHIMKSFSVYKVILLIHGIHLILRSNSMHPPLQINLYRLLTRALRGGSECKWEKQP